MPLFDIFRKHKKEEKEKPIDNLPPQEPEKSTIATPTQAAQEPEKTPETKTEPEAEVAKEPLNELEVAKEPTKEPEKPIDPVQEPKMETEPAKIYLKAMPLRELSDLEAIKADIKNGNILILKMSPLASKNIEDVKRAVNELSEFAESIGGDIARLGEERVVICPKNIRIWREKKSVANEPVPTVA